MEGKVADVAGPLAYLKSLVIYKSFSLVIFYLVFCA